MGVARAIAHPTDDLRRVSGAVLNMVQKHAYLAPEVRPTSGKKTENWFTPADCVTAAVILRLWEAGFMRSDTFEAAVQRLAAWRVTDENPDWQPGDPDPTGEPHPDRPASPAGFVLRDFAETGADWTLRVDVRRHQTTGGFRHVAALIRGDTPMGNGITDLPGEEVQSAHVLPLTGILAQIASHTVFKGSRDALH
jgi:hypothetical protein